MNFTWFASAFDTDDVPFRVLTLVQMGGVLVLAAGVPAALDHDDYRAVTFGYAIMRIGLIAHWLRAAIDDPSSRETALRYAAGIALAEVAWIGRLALDEAGLLSDATRLAAFGALVLFELAIPLWAERSGPTSWHPRHIAERYGLFAIILFGESVFAASTGVERRCRRAAPACRWSRSAPPRSCSSSPSGGSTSSSRPARASSSTATAPTCGATATTASWQRSPRSAPASSSRSSRSATRSPPPPAAVGYAIAIPVAAFVLTDLGAARPDRPTPDTPSRAWCSAAAR